MKTLRVIVVNEVPDSTNVIRKLLRKRKGLTDKATAPLPNSVVEALNRVRLAAVFTNRAVALGRENGSVGCPKIGVADRTLTIEWRQGLP